MLLPRRLSVALAALCAASLAQAQFTTVGPFTGSAAEGFETQNTSGGAFPVCVADRVFGGQADLCTANGNTGAHITGGWSFGCTIQERSGVRFFGGAGNPVRYTFDDAIDRFGGWFGTNSPSASDGVILFYDAAGTLLHNDLVVAPNDCTWTWNGWDTGGVPVKSIELIGNHSNGGYLMMDDMEVSIVPTVSAFCFCDSTGMPAPCSNVGQSGRGCANSMYPGGAELYASGLARVGASTLKLHGKDLVAGWPGIYFQGEQKLNSGHGLLFGDGLRCTGLRVVRLETVMPGLGTTSETTLDLSTAGGNQVAAGDTRYYQLWYRDATQGPCGTGWNLTNALQVTWLP
ncbi:MAG: hypothetical protein H6828_09630 [Planctomycetes bacterium]|nr:hypothetical protein [Planctomycetota bacterium]